MIFRVTRHRKAPRMDGSWVEEALAKSKHPNTIIAVGADTLRAVKALEGKPILSLDTEFYGVNIKKEHPKGKARIGCCQITGSELDGSDRVSVFIPNWGEYQGTIRQFKKVLEEPKAKIIGHNIKVDMHALANEGIVVKDILGDTMVMDYLHTNGDMVLHGLKECSKRYFHVTGAEDYDKTFKANVPKKNGEPSKKFRTMPVDEVLSSRKGILKMFSYAMKDPAMTLDLYLFLKTKLQETTWTATRNYFEYYEWLPRPYTSVLFRIERRGCMINQVKLKALAEKVDLALDEAKADFFRTCVSVGVSQSFLLKFNMGSTKQLAVLFEEKLGVELPKTEAKKGKGGGSASTGVEALEGITNKTGMLVAKKILRYREIAKLKSTYIVNFIRMTKEYGGRLHTEYKQIGAVTGRLSSSKPNLQNIANSEEFNIRELFEADPSSYPGEEVEFADIDMSQIEMRLTAHFTQEPTLLKAIKGKWDLHSLTAFRTYAEVRKAFPEDVEMGEKLLKEVAEKFPKLRKFAKVINFGIIYGLGYKGYSRKTGVSEVRAKRDIYNYFAALPKLRDGIEKVKAYARKHGYVKTLLGRYLYLANVNSPNKSWKAQDERRAFNYKIQGSNADLMQMAMVLIDRDPDLAKWGAQMILQVHDELGLNVVKRMKAKIQEKIEYYVSKSYTAYGLNCLSIETPADLGFGVSWSEAKH